jgi:2-hydroxychromene-2-carboxylate isomerase
MPPLEIWFEFASTYSYPAASRVEDVAAAAGVAVAWRPFLLGPIFRSQGWDDSPFNVYPVTKESLRRQTEEAVARGIFGAPTFVVGDELFWGNDRLEDAIAWCRRAG